VESRNFLDQSTYFIQQAPSIYRTSGCGGTGANLPASDANAITTFPVAAIHDNQFTPSTSILKFRAEDFHQGKAVFELASWTTVLHAASAHGCQQRGQRKSLMICA